MAGEDGGVRSAKNGERGLGAHHDEKEKGANTAKNAARKTMPRAAAAQDLRKSAKPMALSRRLGKTVIAMESSVFYLRCLIIA